MRIVAIPPAIAGRWLASMNMVLAAGAIGCAGGLCCGGGGDWGDDWVGAGPTDVFGWGGAGA
ncbi:hypothetical protein DB30_06479 [Enhygromyxa salina]|uniref:Lipoprotein n=1 Tax=Enhygromyxa salina TaxID=215803 RepID=A0A0C1ZUD6_9BACT|nr:hypothetical protein DB30_06479 [Enhygromyxa salina]